jgi:hypothetical protein
MRAPSLRLLISFWLLSSILVVIWLRGEISDAHLPGYWKAASVVITVIGALAPIGFLYYFRSRFLDATLLGLLVCCCLAISAAYHESNLLRAAMQVSLDHERSFLHTEFVEGIIRPLISIIVDAYVTILGDYNHAAILPPHGGNTYVTHIAINYMFDSASFIAVFALGLILLSPMGAWLCLFMVAFIAQTAPMEGRMGNVFLAGGFFWQLYLLASGRRGIAVASGLVLSFMRTDLVFATAFAIPALAWNEGRQPTSKEWLTFALLIAISIVVPEVLILTHPGANFSSFLVTHGDYFTKIVGNIRSLKLAVALASPMLAVIIVVRGKVSRTVAAVIPPALVYLGIVSLIADYTETRLLGPTLGALAFVCCERLSSFLQSHGQLSPERGTG